MQGRGTASLQTHKTRLPHPLILKILKLVFLTFLGWQFIY